MNRVRTGVLILIIAVSASMAGYYIYTDVVSRDADMAKINEEEQKITDNNLPVKGSEETNKENLKPVIPSPDLSRTIVITAVMGEESKKQALEKIAGLIKSLKANSDLAEEWIELGSYMKLIGDYERAVIYWKYASAIRPKSFLPHANLGDLYLFSIKDAAKAEQSYKTALVLGPDQVMVYEKLSELYKYFLKDDTKAKAVLEDGIAKNPAASDRLKYILENYENN